MSNVSFVSIANRDFPPVDYAIIENADGSQTVMTKAIYEAQQAVSTLPSNSSTPQAGA